MIVPMKKLTVIVQAKDADSTVDKLRKLGVLHVEHQQSPKGKDISVLQDDMVLINEAMGILSQPEFSQKHPKAKPLSDWQFTSRHIVDLWKRLDQLKEYSRNLKKRISQWEPWGEFDPDAIQALKEKGVYIRLYQIPVRDLKNPPAGVIIKRLSTSSGVALCAGISQDRIDIPFKEFALPKAGLEKMRTRLSEDMQVAESIKLDIKKYTCYITDLMRIRKSLQKDLEFQQVLKGLGQFGSLVCLRGYVPYDAVDALFKTSKSERWGITVSEPSEEDRVPTLIRNPRWVSIISPVFKAIEVVPGYRELDISLWFLVFLSIFFGMLIGDSAYGLIFFILTLCAHKKWGRKLANKSIFILLYILSSCAILWGLFTGTFFGQAWLPGWAMPLIPALRNDRYIQTLCFFLGAFHLSIAHCWKGIIKLPSLMALAELGWILILWGAFFLAKALIIGDAFPAFAKWLFIAGPVLVVCFTKLHRNVFKGIGAGIGNLLLNFVNSFTDVVSYIRLFAVGLATVAVADAFNKMAMDVGFNSLMAACIASFILLLGHILNIILGPMAVLVHGVRLNVLEFCNHTDVKWSGFSYNPLREDQNSQYGTGL